MTLLLVEAFVKSTMLVAAAALIHLFLRRKGSAATRHLVLTLAVIALLLLPAFLVAVPRWNLNVPIAGDRIALAPRAIAPTIDADAPVFTAAAQPAAPSSRERLTPSRQIAPPAPARGVRWELVSLGMYALGVAVLIVRLARQRRAVELVARHAEELQVAEWMQLFNDCAQRLGIDRPVRLLRSRDETVPMTFGTRTPTIVVPAVADTWDDDRRRAVLLHELAHVARRDCATQMLAAVACAVYWFHPGAWWIARRLRDEREIACDDRVVAAGTRATDYAGHLLELAYACAGDRAPALVLSMARPNEIEARMRALLDAARNRSTPALRIRLWSAVAAIAILAVLAAARATLVPVNAQADARSASAQNRPTLLDAADQQPAESRPRSDAAARAIAEGQAGTWEVWMRPDGKSEIRISERQGSWQTITLETSKVEGAWRALGGSANGTMTVAMDAGTFMLEGVIRERVGAGTFTFAPSSTFPAEMVKRGFARPTAVDQYLLARSDIGFAFIDELSKQGYARPDLPLLVRAAEHGVSLNRLRDMGQLGYRLGTIQALITLTDHGVDPDFVRELAALGYKNISADDLLRTRDHGVDPEYISELRTLGFGQMTLEALVRTRDHGIDPEYIRDMRQLGYQLPLDELTRARDHGIDPEYVNAMTGFFGNLTLETLLNARDHGVDSEYVREMRELGYQATLTDLIQARDHGVDTSYVRELAALGYKGLSLEQLIRLRDHGVDASFVKDVQRQGTNAATPDDLIRRRDGGAGSGKRYVIDRLIETWKSALRDFNARGQPQR
jgi:beta-lactamase regulating signal transducer with metallopeptidase domain